jgi:hypothetical protein
MPAEQLTEFRTEQLSLAVFLKLEGNCHQKLEMRGDKAVWVFLVTDELIELVNDFQLDVAQVSPKEFIDELSSCRRELFKFLDGHRNGTIT